MATFLPPCCPTRLNASPNQLGDGFGHTSHHKTRRHGTQRKTAAVRPQQTQAVEKSSHQVSFKMSYPKIKTTKRDVTAKELAERFNCSTRTVFRAWSQSRTDYLNENSISRDKPWEQLGISRATWYRRGKPLHPQGLT